MKSIQYPWRALITHAISTSLTGGSPTRPLVAAIFFGFVGPKDTNVNDVVLKGRRGLLREAISALPGMPEGNLNHSRNRVRANSDALEDLVLGNVANYKPKARGQCTWSSACTWFGQLSDSVDLATQVEACDGSGRSRKPSRQCRGG